MGQEVSNQIDDKVPPQTLSDRSLDAVAELIRSGKARRIVALTGAGISTAAGIPDFRSPGTGLYANLKRLNLPYAEAVFSIDYFRENPRPFYVLAKELYPGQFHPTVSHAFLALLAKKGLLRMLFTQNIDCLERAAGVPADLIVEAHGSFATQRCISCHTPFPDEKMRAHVRDAHVPRCASKECTTPGGGLVKPDIVFFGENLPARFHDLRMLPATDADLVLVLGTSLTVYPFAGLPTLAPSAVPRVLFNREAVGDLGSRADDVLALGTCDAGVLKLADALGWRTELDALWRGVVGDIEADKQLIQGPILAAQPEYHSSSSEDEDEGDVGDVDDHDDYGAGASTKDAEVDDTNDQPPEIGGALSSAEVEVNEIADEIEAILKLDDAKDELSKTSAETESIKAENTEELAPESASTTTEAPVTKEQPSTDKGTPKLAGGRPQL